MTVDEHAKKQKMNIIADGNEFSNEMCYLLYKHLGKNEIDLIREFDNIKRKHDRD